MSNPDLTGNKRKMQEESSGDNTTGRHAKHPKDDDHTTPYLHFRGDSQNTCREHSVIIKDPISGEKQIIQFQCALDNVWEENTESQAQSQQLASTSVAGCISKSISGDICKALMSEDLKGRGYEMRHQLAKGKYGTVMLATSSTDRHKSVAVKLLLKNVKRKMRKSSGSPSPTSTEIPDEVLLQQDIKHPYIVELLDYFSVRGNICIVLEFCSCGNLEQLLRLHDYRAGKFLMETAARRYFHQMTEAIHYLHINSIVHRDLKSANFVIDSSNTIKLCDFGSAKRYMIGDHFCHSRSGCSSYQAPEVLENVEHDPRLADIWSLGVLLFVMVTGRLPFGQTTTSTSDTLKMMQRGISFNFHRCTQVIHLSDDIKHLVRNLLMYKPELRFSWQRIRLSKWYKNESESKIQIGNFYLQRLPRKVVEGNVDKSLKERIGI